MRYLWSKYFLIVLCLLQAMPGVSEASLELSLGTGLVVEKDSDGRNYSARAPWLAQAGYRFDKYELFVEHSRFYDQSGESTYTINRTHEEWGVGLSYSFLTWKNLRLFSAYELGRQQEVVKTQAGTVSSVDYGDGEWLHSLRLGTTSVLWRGLYMSGELRADFSSNFNPNPRPGGFLLLGYLFDREASQGSTEASSK